MKRSKVYALSLVLGVATLFVIALLRMLPYSAARVAVTDALSLPGGIVAGLLYSEGVHTSSGSAAWAWVAIAGNVAFYIVAWFILLSIVSRCAQARRRPKSN